MANDWKSNPIVLDTAASDSSYDSANDVLNGGAQYSSMPYHIKKISVSGAANGNAVSLKTCSPTTVEGSPFLVLDMETGDLNKQVDFHGCYTAQGIYPETIAGSCKVYIYH